MTLTHLMTAARPNPHTGAIASGVVAAVANSNGCTAPVEARIVGARTRKADGPVVQLVEPRCTRGCGFESRRDQLSRPEIRCRKTRRLRTPIAPKREIDTRPSSICKEGAMTY